MKIEFIIIISILLWILALGIAYLSKISWIAYGAALLWFIPLLNFESIFLKIFSIVMMVATIFIFARLGREKGDF